MVLLCCFGFLNEHHRLQGTHYWSVVTFFTKFIKGWSHKGALTIDCFAVFLLTYSWLIQIYMVLNLNLSSYPMLNFHICWSLKTELRLPEVCFLMAEFNWPLLVCCGWFVVFFLGLVSLGFFWLGGSGNKQEYFWEWMLEYWSYTRLIQGCCSRIRAGR